MLESLLESLKNEIDSCQLMDRHRLRRKIGDIERESRSRAGGKGLDGRIKSLTELIEKSKQACSNRTAAIPNRIEFPENLPVSGKAEEIAGLIREHQVLIVAGDTGSGKTTQLPKICLQAGLGRVGLIGHTQPRRLAAVSVADRIADELNTEVGRGVGYQVRFNEKVSESSYLKLMTDGILLAEIQQDRFLNRYEVLIIDEAHERSLNIDFLLGFLSQLLPKRPDLKLIITSATIDVEKFSAHFNNAPIVSVSGRTFPVETRYAPIDAGKNSRGQLADDETQLDAIIDAVAEINRSDRASSKPSGDVLVFLSSEREIRETANKLRKQKFPNTEILPLYARLRHSEQLKIFKPHQGRRVVLATNVAETSITVPGINYVIDSGCARISRYSLQSKVQRLPIEPVSQASANQRQGRCGRVADGICIRLYSEDDFNSRPLYTDPEIKRTNLAAVILRMMFLRLGDAEDFPFLEPPEQRAINEGFKLLVELNALTSQRKLTENGRKMAVLPVDPKYARMVVEANQQGCLEEVLIIVSALSIQDPREISGENRQQAQQKLAEFNHPESDFLGFVNLWKSYEEKRQSYAQNQLRKYCRTHFLSFSRMREWREVHRQLSVTCQQLGFRVHNEAASYQSVHLSIISGSLNQIASRIDGRNYLGNRNRKFSLFSSSVVGANPASWIVTGDLIETSQTFASLAAKIQPQWVEQMAPHLVKREHFEPHWSKKRQQVMAYEKVTLYGLVIIEKSLIPYMPIDAIAARQIFIREGLAAAQLKTNCGFYQHNLDFLETLSRQEEKIRRPDFIISERDVVHFYEGILPENICSTRDLEQWLRKQGKTAAATLEMTLSNLVESESKLVQLEQYPDRASVHQNPLSIDYVFDPGSERDGATLEVPLAIINQLTQADVDWAVPGIIREKCVTLLKGLPKSLRKNFIPVSGFVDDILPQMNSLDGELVDSLIAQIRNKKKLVIGRSEFQGIELPRHLLIKISVLDEEGKELAFGAGLEELKQRLRTSSTTAEASPHKTNYRHELEARGLKDWEFDELPEQIEIGDELKLIRFPALVDRGDSVDIEIFADRQQAAAHFKPGLVRLTMLRSVQQCNMLKKKFSRFLDRNALKLSGKLSGLVEDAMFACYVEAFEIDERIPRDKESFENFLSAGKSRLLGIGDKIESILTLILDQQLEITKKLQRLDGMQLDYLKTDISQQLSSLVYAGFLSNTGLLWLKEYPRYYQSINQRLGKAPHMGDKDKSHTELVNAYWHKYTELLKQSNSVDIKELKLLRWMIEEYRVSLFSQALGTRIAVSEKRLGKQVEKLANSVA